MRERLRIPVTVALVLIQIISGCGGNAGGNRVGTHSGNASDWTTMMFAPWAGVANAPSRYSLAWNGTRMVAVSGADGLRVSTNGAVWQPFLFNWYNDVAWDGSNFVAVGDGLASSASGDGLIWIRSAPTGAMPKLASVVGSGQVWVAVGAGGTIRFAAASAPTTWTPATSPTSNDLSAVTWTGNQFVAVGDVGTVVTSPNGFDWTLQPPATFRYGMGDIAVNLGSVAAASGSSIVAITSGFSPQQILFSSDGALTWRATANNVSGIRRVSYSGANGGQYVAVGSDYPYTSTDGLSWNPAGPAVSLDATIFDGNRFIGVGGSAPGFGSSASRNGFATYSSNDGLSWSLLVISRDLGAISISETDGRMVAVPTGFQGGSEYGQTSLNGVTWEYGTNYSWFIDLVWAPTLNAFVALVPANGYDPLLPHGASVYGIDTSTDGRTWTRIGNAPCYGSIAASSSSIVSAGTSLNGPCLASTVSGTIWTAQTVPGGKGLNKAFWTGSQFIAVGDAGVIATAPGDGATWTARASGVNVALRGAAGSAATLVVVGDKGTLLASTDSGQTWQAQSSRTTSNLNRVIWTGSEFVVVGANATLLRSGDGLAWAQQATPYSPGSATYLLDFTDVSWSPTTSLLTVVGSSGFTATLH